MFVTSPGTVTTRTAGRLEQCGLVCVRLLATADECTEQQIAPGALWRLRANQMLAVHGLA